MNLRTKILLYLGIIHLLIAGVALLVVRENRVWLIPAELFLLISLGAGYKLVMSFFGPLDLIRTGTQFMQEKDFTSRFQKVGQPEMDELIDVYNRMIDHLREERLRVREQHYLLDKILTASPSAILTLDFDGRIALVNPATERILEILSSELLGRRLDQLDSPFWQSLHRLPVGESQILPLFGRRRLHCRKSVFLDRGFARQFIMIEELTEELRRAEKAAYEKLIRMMSHEVNNSLGASNSLLNSCLNYKDQLNPEDQVDFENALRIAISRTDHLSAFTRGFADVIRLPRPLLRPCNVVNLLKNIEGLLRVECERRQIHWQWEVPDSFPLISMDRNQMEQVFVNILKNAMEAIGTKGFIAVRLGQTIRRSHVEIADTGPGIPPEIQTQLFTPFFTTKENGQGIGLTLAQEILSLHGFDFSLESLPGQPTRFRILF